MSADPQAFTGFACGAMNRGNWITRMRIKIKRKKRKLKTLGKRPDIARQPLTIYVDEKGKAIGYAEIIIANFGDKWEMFKRFQPTTEEEMRTFMRERFGIGGLSYETTKKD